MTAIFVKSVRKANNRVISIQDTGTHSVVAVAFRSEEEVFLKRGASLTYFCAALDPPLGESGQKAETHVQGHDYFIPTEFGQHPSICSVGKAMCSHTCT